MTQLVYTAQQVYTGFQLVYTESLASDWLSTKYMAASSNQKASIKSTWFMVYVNKQLPDRFERMKVTQMLYSAFGFVRHMLCTIRASLYNI